MTGCSFSENNSCVQDKPGAYSSSSARHLAREHLEISLKEKTMSAYICDDRHITALAAAIVECGADEQAIANATGHGLARKLEAAREVAAVLFAANAESVGVRYSETVDEVFTFHEATARDLLASASEHEFKKPPAVRLLKAIACFKYQACETRTWDDSRARAALEACERKLVRLVPGYDDAPWGW